MSSLSNTESSTADLLDRLATFFETEGARAYLGEGISMSEHMTQAAMRAEMTGASKALVAAALLHDIGYFSEVRQSATDRDREHDEAGARFLRANFGPAVTEPVRLHVQAKRYLCAVEPDYHDKLSPASVRTLRIQGGPMSAAECKAFEANPYYKEALQIRRFDDEGKIEGRPMASFDHYRPLLASLRTS